MESPESHKLYQTMAHAIAYLRDHAKERPAAHEVAAAVDMSVSRFEHAFATWVGTTPKRFLSYISKEHARALLLQAKKNERVIHSTGLSSAGRLHDLMVTYEAMTPAEVKAGNIAIDYGLHPSPFGWCVIGITKRGICQLAFIETNSEAEARVCIHERWPHALLSRDQKKTAVYARQLFDAQAKRKPLHLLVKGTNFQVKVWEALLRIPPGEVSNYGAIAQEIGLPRAVRAVGTACGKNAIAWLIPCHRVLAGDGGMGGYRWGVERKEAILAWEHAQKD